ncbi:MAG: 4-alpha-glucanotransferase [Bacilli bacterium]|nr:4-alpha-glucanotransferase [Bacilli bacterium]
MKRIGLFAPLFSLPNQYGIGDFSECAILFIDYLSRIRYSCWQILPLNPTDLYGSPYTPVSSFALDDIYVSLTDLKKRGLIGEIIPYMDKSKRVNYAKVRKYKEAYFNLAYDNFVKFNQSINELNEFKKKEPRIVEYATYKVLRRINKSKYWNQWKINNIDEKHQDDVNREIFKQYILFKEWGEIHNYAKEKGITIIGDLPFYVGYDSADVYFNREAFLLDEKFNPTVVAGVPPDYYSEDGQLWGNPIYDWNYLREHNFSLVVERILFTSKIYDVTRLDHFRAFDTYYEIPSDAKNAKIGEWKEAPGYELFDYLYSKKPDIQLIAEDLGDMREEVFYLRDHFNLPGMQVIQFTLIDEEIRHNSFPHVFKRENSIIYVSTHDSYTGLGWIDILDEETRNAVINYLDNTYGQHHVITNLFNYVASQPADTVILSITDILRLGKNGRINVPGVKSKNNWTFRLKDYVGLMKNEAKLVKLVTQSGRSA